MAPIRTPVRQRLPGLAIVLAFGFCAALLFNASSASSDLAGSDYQMHLPFVVKPVPTPTPTPTATPLPRIPDVRVEGEDSCSRFRGGSRQDPNGEYVCFRNYDSQPADMTNWQVWDASQHTYTFPPFVLNVGATVKLHSGPGSNSATDLYWGRGLVWNNDHDTVHLYDAFGRLVNSYVY